MKSIPRGRPILYKEVRGTSVVSSSVRVIRPHDRTATPVYTRAPPPARPCSPTPAHRPDARTPPSDRHRAPFLPQSGLSIPWRRGLGESPRQWPSPWRPLAAVAVRRLSPLLSGDPRHDFSRQACRCRAHRTRHRVRGREFRDPGHRTGVRGRPQYRPAVVSRSGSAAPSLFATRPARCAGHAGPTR
jgi:hypothetical protein